MGKPEPVIGADRLAAGEVVTPADVLGEPQPLLREIPPGAPYPVEALGPLREAVETVQRMTQAPVAIPAQSALSIAALAVQGHADVDTLGGPRALSLYCLTIAGSGERKSACDSLMTTALREFEQEQARQYREARKAWVKAHALWKRKCEAILAKVVKSQVDPSELTAIGPEPEAPALPDRTVTEPTYEGLTRLFAEGMPSLGLFSDEGGQFLGGFAMSKDNRQKTLSALNDLWQGNPIKRTRQGDGAFTLYGRRLSLHLMVQPVVAYPLLADPLAGDSGFLPRCLICEPASTIGTRLYSRSGSDAGPIADFGERLGDVLNTGLRMDPDTRELKVRPLHLSLAARKSLIAFHDEVEAAQRPGGAFDSIKGYASKAAEQAARIAGVLTLWADLGMSEVPAARMENGIALARYYLGEANRLAGAASISEATQKAEALRTWLQSPSWGKRWVTLREITNRGPNRLRERTEALKAVQSLVEAGWLVPNDANTILDGQARRESWTVIA